MSNATHSHGITITRNGYTIAELTKISGIEMTRDMKDVTSHQSEEKWEEAIAGIKRSGEVPIEGNYIYTDTNGQLAMAADFNSGSIVPYVITFPTGSIWSFNGIISKLKPVDDGGDDKIPFSASIKVTGKPTFTTASSTGFTTPFFAMSESAVIAPDPANDVYEYVANVLTGVSSITITPTASAGTITVNGNEVTSGEASSSIALGAAGTITNITVIVTETGKAPKTYVIHVVRAAS